ncbi:MAG: glycosyl transferase family 2 [Bacteroidetes bacterium HGW-Bacteroidetes-2]|jgi:GT2 family glycosyltransferase|nr:MAG: glycosyl transferase family 2 [Bacteroidetes bacterium HGW-Bacteroidetes-2]
MSTLTILYAYRNREAQRVQLSLQSLQQQTTQNFEVVFVDYGSEPDFAKAVQDVVESFAFATYYYVAHPGLLWNKSKALNYGIRQTKTPFILIADVDLLFAPNAVAVFKVLTHKKTFSLFQVGYLPKSISLKEIEATPFERLTPKHTGDTFGIGLFSKDALEKVLGLDEFFHFYGSEDEDLNARLLQAGFGLFREPQTLFLHIWHSRYPQKEDLQLTKQPRLLNAQRINQEYFLRQKALQHIFPLQQQKSGVGYTLKDAAQLKKPEVSLQLPNIAAKVTHFLEVELPFYEGKVIAVHFFEDPYCNSLKYRVKKWLGKQTQPYMTMKEVNDAVLRNIIFKYRHHNYSFMVSDNLQSIDFAIDLTKKINA